MDVLTSMKRSRMTGFQYLTILISLVIVTIDGFDVFVMGFVLPHLPEGFIVDDAQRGILLSAGLFGMAAGALLLAPLADRIGRRRLIILSLVICSIGMTGSVFAHNGAELTGWRVLTGVGIGSMATSLAVLVQEYTSDRARGVVFGIYSIGFPLGSALGGYIGVVLVAAFNGAWQAMFALGAILTVAALILAIFGIPESVHYLVAREPKNAQRQIDRIARRLRNPQIDPLARPERRADQPRGTFAGLFQHGRARRTILLWVAYACLMIAFYFANTWTPQLVTSATGDPEAGTTAGLILSAGGFIGAITFALLSVKFSAGRVVWISMAAGGLSMLGLAAMFKLTGPALIMTTLVGSFTYIAITAITTLIVPLYQAESRATASGSMVGIGRLFSIASPLAVGFLVSYVAPEWLYAFAAIPLLIGAGAAFMLWRIIAQETTTKAVLLPAAAARSSRADEGEEAAVDRDSAVREPSDVSGAPGAKAPAV